MLARRLCRNIFMKEAVTTLFPIPMYESKSSLKSIYPNSNLDITKKFEVPMSSSTGSFTGLIPIEDLDITYSRSSGPGGQNVNKVNTKVDIRFHLKNAKWLPEETKNKMQDQYKTSINTAGYVIVKSDRTRSQQLNLVDALDKLRYMINRAEYTPPPPSYKDLEIKRRRMEKSSRERLREKRDRGLIKEGRQGI